MPNQCPTILGNSKKLFESNKDVKLDPEVNETWRCYGI